MKYPSLPVAGTALALCRRRLLVTAAVAALAALASAGVGHAQDQPVVPAAPTVALRSCDTGCLIVDAGSFTYTDGSALALPPDGAYALANGGDAPLLEVQGRRTGATRWADWNHVADHDVHWGVRRGDVSGHLEARGLRDGSSYDVRARVRDPNDPANAVSDWSTVASAAPAAWPGVSALRADVGPVTGAHEHEGRYALHLSWTAPVNGPSYSGYYVSAAYVVGDEFDCHNDLNRADPYRVFNNLIDNEFVAATAAEIETEAGALGGPLRVCVSPAVGPDDGRQVALAQARGAVPSVVHNPQVRRRADGGHVLSWMPAELSDGVITASQWRYHTHDLVEVDGHPVENWSEPVTVTGAASEVEFTFPAEPRHGDPYLFSVRSKSGTGWGAWSNSGGHYRFARNHPPTVESPIDDITLLGVVEPMNANGTHDYRDEQRAVIGLLDVFTDYDGHPLRYAASSSDTDAAWVQMTGSYTLTVYAADPGEAVVTVTASDGHGGTVKDEFTVTVEDPFDPWVYDINGGGRIDERGWRLAKSDYAACASWVTDPDNAARPSEDVVSRIGCYGETGKPYLNLMLVKRLHEQGHVRVYLSWADTVDGNDGHAVVGENVGTLQVHVRRHQPAPAGGAVYDLLLAGNTPGASDADVHPFSSQVTIAEGQREGSATLKVVDDRIDETRRYRGVSDHDPEAHETFIVTAVSPDGVRLGRVLLSIRDDDGSVDAPLVPCDRDGATCNERPQPNGLPDLLLLNERENRSVSLAQAFSDPEGDALTLTAKSSNASVATAAVTGQTLVVDPQSKGNAVITVSARDSAGGEASTSFVLTVRAAPAVDAPIADISNLVKGAARQVSLSGVFRDPDGGSLTHEAVSSNEAVVQVSLTAQQLTVTATGRGTATVTVTAVDEDGNRTDDPFTVAVLNQAPTLTGTLGDLVFAVAGGSRQVPLSGLFSDQDGDALTYQASSSDTSKATAAVSGSTLTVTAMARGMATTTVTAIDGRGGSVAESFGVTVKAAPIAKDSLLSDLTLVEETGTDRTLAGVFVDPDGDALSIRAQVSNHDAVHVDVYDGTLHVFGVAPGTATVTLTATDSDGNAAQGSFTVTVTAAPEPEPDNAPPVVAYYLGDETLFHESDAYDVPIARVFKDPDGDALIIRAAASNASVVTATVSSDYGTLALVAQSRGTATVTATAADGRGGSVSQSFTVTVKAAPVVASAISDVSDLEEGYEHDVALSGVFHDADGDDLHHWAESTDDGVAYAFVDASMLTVVGESPGSATITVYAEDVDGNRTHASFAVTVVEPAGDGAADVSCPEHYRHVHDGGDHWHSFFANEYSGECDHSVGRLSGNVNYHEHEHEHEQD